MSWVVEGRNSFLISQPLLQRRFVLLLERQQSATKMYENKTLQFDWLREQFLFWEKRLIYSHNGSLLQFHLLLWAHYIRCNYLLYEKQNSSMTKVDIAVLRPEKKDKCGPLFELCTFQTGTKHMMRLPVMQHNKSFAFHCDLAAIS